MLIDVSNHQGTINWDHADPAIDGAYIKVTEGTGYVDPYWQTNHAGVVAGGKPVGAYHFADGANPIDEANHFADQCLRATWQLDPVLDAEVPAVGWAWVVAFRGQFRARTGVARFRVYTSTGYLIGQLNPVNWIDGHTSIWAAHYAASIGWSHPQLVLWQNTSAATIPGVLGSVDADQYQNGWTPAADQGGTMTPEQIAQLFNQIGDLQLRVASMHAGQWLPWQGNPANPGGDLTWFQRQSTTALAPVMAQLAAIQGALSTDEAALLAAVKAQPTGAQVDVTGLATALAPVLLPLLPLDITPAQLGAAVTAAVDAEISKHIH